MSKRQHSGSSPSRSTPRPLSGKALQQRNEAVEQAKNWNGQIDPVLWQRAQQEQDEQEQANASPVPVVFPANE